MAGYAVEHVVPAAVQGDAFRGHPRGAERAHGALEVADHGDQDVDGHDHEREALEPVGVAQLAPVILQDHEADASGGCRVELRVVEPAVHVQVRRVVQRPVGTGGGADVDGDEVGGQDGGDHQKAGDAAGLRASRDLVEPDEGQKNHHPSDPLVDGGVAVDLEQHDDLP